MFFFHSEDVKMADLAAVGIKAYSNGFLVRTGMNLYTYIYNYSHSSHIYIYIIIYIYTCFIVVFAYGDKETKSYR